MFGFYYMEQRQQHRMVPRFRAEIWTPRRICNKKIPVGSRKNFDSHAIKWGCK